MCSVDDPEYPEIEVCFDPRRPLEPQEFAESIWAEANWLRQELLWANVNRLRQKLLLLQPSPLQSGLPPRRSPAQPPQQPCPASKVTDMGTEKPERRVLESQRAGAGVEASGKPTLSSKEM